MATFTGTFSEFYYWFDATVKDWVKVKTKKERGRLVKAGGCQQCSTIGVTLQAHHQPLGRRALVQHALGVTSDKELLVDRDLKEAFDLIEKAHKPFADHLRYLCDPCHKAVHAASGDPE